MPEAPRIQHSDILYRAGIPDRFAFLTHNAEWMMNAYQKTSCTVSLHRGRNKY
ncbi:hypothetical protein DPMN_072600 [Dreissena polymorpha]|uniref:Uncharacterized protein n=1 Tax=Dreissena polymorpha TaxID=45954 RepID=A0A9D4HBR0_DREPO|nr:hypothetical protein DPMN_072600 [Dreissena polymorpha]